MKTIDSKALAARRANLTDLVRARKLAPGQYRIDAAGIVSKYIGETEKNLGATAFTVDAHDAVLPFDEADALFGKRTQIGDAHDRYVNVDAEPPKTR